MKRFGVYECIWLTILRRIRDKPNWYNQIQYRINFFLLISIEHSCIDAFHCGNGTVLQVDEKYCVIFKSKIKRVLRVVHFPSALVILACLKRKNRCRRLFVVVEWLLCESHRVCGPTNIQHSNFDIFHISKN